MMITKIKIVPSVGKREAILEILRTVVDTVQGWAGCKECAVYEQSGGEGAILYLDQWLSVEDLSRYIQSNLYIRMLLAIELASRAPQISFHEISDTRGLAWIEALRAEGDLIR
jgi:quinol monooxygenase YgiN